MEHIVYLALGTNLGDRPANLKSTVVALSPFIVVSQTSPIYETPPWGFPNQPAFLNMALKGETCLTPQELLDSLKRLEFALGRVPGPHWGPRKIDMDILFYDEIILASPGLTIPHPHLHERAFVLVPLADLAPELVHPVFGKTVHQLLTVVDITGVKRYG